MVGNTQFFRYFTGCQTVHTSDITKKKKKNQVIFITKLLTIPRNVCYNVSIIDNYRQLLTVGGRNMAEIINFLEAKQRIENAEIKRACIERKMWERTYFNSNYEPVQAPPPAPAMPKKALAVSALPGEAIPPDYEDLRPALQQPGLILLSWAIWENFGVIGTTYRVNWVKSIGKLKLYATDFPLTKDIRGVLKARPEVKGDWLWRQGEITRHCDRIEPATAVFICAPELTAQTRPFFIDKLKNTGVKVNFDFDFSLGYAKKLEFKKQVEQIQALGTPGVRNA
jgi:hypothetical protein